VDDIMIKINNLTQRALELQSKGLVVGQIADELNISRETATWLLMHPKKEGVPAPKDISVDWSQIGRSSYRLRYISHALVDMILENLNESGDSVDVVVGIAVSGLPLASMIADGLGTEFATFYPNKQRWEPDVEYVRGAISQNFANIDGKKCVIVDDVITTGTTIEEAVELLREHNANPTAIAVLIDKRGSDTIKGVPLISLIRIVRVD